ncbi:glycosyltransferase family 4 protein [Pontibacillus salicampi]|uniref:glycosyltransferase family 4 protein n=1 Tax=Pontibacillus salicampi TaxID=1449801 RepID=UPI00366DD8B0
MLLFLQYARNSAECVLVVPNKGELEIKAREMGLRVIIQSFPIGWSLWESHAGTYTDIISLGNDQRISMLQNLLTQERPDAIVANTCVNIAPAIAAKKEQIPVAWMIHEILQTTAYTPHAVGFIQHYADWVIGVSEVALSFFQQETYLLYPTYEIKHVMESNESQHRETLRTQLGVNQKELLIGMLAADIIPSKGVDHFISMALLLASKYPSVHFLITGNQTDSSYFHNCMKKVKMSPYNNRFHQKTYIKDVATIYPALDVVVVPSLVKEGFGLTALEGMIFGKPVVAYRSGGLVEILQKTGNGDKLANHGNIRELSSIVEKLIQEKGRLAEVGKQSKLAAMHIFGADRFQQQIIQQLQIVCNKPPTSHMLPYVPQGVLIKSEEGTAIFIVEHGFKRHIVTEQDFAYYRYKWENICILPEVTVHSIPHGKPISSMHSIVDNGPNQFLIKASTGEEVSMIRNGTIYPIVSEEVFRHLNFSYNEIITVEDDIYNRIPRGNALEGIIFERGIVNGKLVTFGTNELYYTEEDTVRLITDEVILSCFHLSFQDCIHLPIEALERMQKGKPILPL